MGYRTTRVSSPEWTVRYQDVRCDGCDEPLEPVSDLGVESEDGTGWRMLQPQGGLVLEIVGGYGMAFDDLQIVSGVERPKVVFCRICTEDLRITVPAIARAIAERTG